MAAERHAGAGRTVEALHGSCEAHRLLSAAVHAATAAPDSPEAPPAQRASVGSDLWWRTAAEYLGVLLQLGGLFDAGGLPDEAAQALQEAQRLVSPPLIGTPTPHRCKAGSGQGVVLAGASR
jgi:hypothetical protein